VHAEIDQPVLAGSYASPRGFWHVGRDVGAQTAHPDTDNQLPVAGEHDEQNIDVNVVMIADTAS